jgi:hypothetical protein
MKEEDLIKKFNSKERDNCAKCGEIQFEILPTNLPNTDISEAVMLKCKNCEHTRLELM